MTVGAVGFSGPTWVQSPGNGTATVFNFPFLITANSDLVVGFITGGLYAEQFAGYTVSGINNDGGGQVTFATAPPLNTTVDLRSLIPETQPTNFSNLGPYLPENTTAAVDRVTRLVTDLCRLTYLFGIHAGDDENTPWPALPPPSSRAGGVLIFDPTTGLPTVGVPNTQTITTGLLAPFLGLNASAAEITAGATIVNYYYAQGDVRRYGADPTGATASDVAFATAEAVAFVGGLGKIYAPAGIYVLSGTLTLRSGVTLIGDGCTAEYYPGSYSTVQVTQLWKKSTGTAGALFILATASAIKGAYLRHDLVGGQATGVVQIGTSNASQATSVFNAALVDVSIYGCSCTYTAGTPLALQDASSIGIYFYPGSVANTSQRYGCRFTDVTVANCYSGMSLGENCNANRITGITFKDVYQHYILNGGAGQSCVENVSAGSSHFNIGQLPQTAITFTASLAMGATGGTLSSDWILQSGVYAVLFSQNDIRLVTLTNGATTASWSTGLLSAATTAATANITVVFILTNSAIYNTFAAYATECYGAAYYIDASSSVTTSPNTFIGTPNEQYFSFIPPNNTDSNYAQPVNRSQNSTLLIPNVATPQNYANGQAALTRQPVAVGGTLPQLNGSGTLVAANVNSKVFVRFGSVVTGAAGAGFIGKVKVILGAPGGGVGISIVTVEFWCRITNNTLLPSSLSVISVNQRPSSSNYIIGLKFLTGVAAALPYGLAIVGGVVGAVSANLLLVDLEILPFTYSVNSVAMANLYTFTWGCVPATANDVTDAIDLLTVADTAFTA